MQLGWSDQSGNLTGKQHSYFASMGQFRADVFIRGLGELVRYSEEGVPLRRNGCVVTRGL